MKAILRIGQAATLLHVSTKSTRRWDKAGLIQCFRTPGGHRSITRLEVKRIKSGQPLKKLTLKPAIYAWVSSHEQKQKGDLQRQITAIQQYCQAQGYHLPQMFLDTGNGLNTKRRGFAKLCRAIEFGQVNHVVLTYPDRLTRFGFQYLEHYFASHGAHIEFLNSTSNLTIDQELVQDLIAIITSFSGRVHGLRSARARRARQAQQSSKTRELTITT